MSNGEAQAQDKTIWRKIKDDYYSPSIRARFDGKAITICVGGLCITKPIEEWHNMAKDYGCIT